MSCGGLRLGSRPLTVRWYDYERVRIQLPCQLLVPACGSEPKLRRTIGRRSGIDCIWDLQTSKLRHTYAYAFLCRTTNTDDPTCPYAHAYTYSCSAALMLRDRQIRCLEWLQAELDGENRVNLLEGVRAYKAIRTNDEIKKEHRAFHDEWDQTSWGYGPGKLAMMHSCGGVEVCQLRSNPHGLSELGEGYCYWTYFNGDTTQRLCLYITYSASYTIHYTIQVVH